MQHFVTERMNHLLRSDTKVLDAVHFIRPSLRTHRPPDPAGFLRAALRFVSQPLCLVVPIRYAVVQHALDLSIGYPDAYASLYV